MLTQTKENIPNQSPQTNYLPQRRLASCVLASAKKGWAWLSLSCFMGLMMACQAGTWSSPLPFLSPSPDTTVPITATTTMPSSLRPLTLLHPSTWATFLHSSSNLTVTQTPCQTGPVSLQAAALLTKPAYNDVSWSPDEDLLAYVMEDSVWLATGPTYQPQRLVQIADSRLGQVLWSPDGQHLAVSSSLQSKYIFVIWVVQRDGQVVVNDQAYERPIILNRWLDNHRLAFKRWEGTGTQGMWQFNLLTGKATQVVTHHDYHAYGGDYYWSPSANQLVIDHHFYGYLVLTNILSTTHQVDPQSEFWLSENKFWLGQGEAPFQRFIDWSPDETFFLYSQADPGRYGGYFGTHDGLYNSNLNLRRWDVAQQQSHKLWPQVLQAALSPDGRQVAFLQQLNQPYSPPRLYAPPRYRNKPLPPSSQPPRLLLGRLDLHTGAVQYYGPGGYRPNEGPSWWRGGRPVWSPDGQMIAYWNEAGQVWVVSADGVKQQCLWAEADVVQVSWSFDSRKLALQLLDRFVIVAFPLRLE